MFCCSRNNFRNQQQLTPLQARIQRSRRRQQLTSIRYLLTVLSGSLLSILIVYFCITQLLLPATQLTTTNNVVLHRDWPDEDQQEGQQQQPELSKHVGYPHHLEHSYYPWNTMFGTTTTSATARAATTKKKRRDQQSNTTNGVVPVTVAAPNPAVHGWTPDIYPNPITNPIGCAISYIIDSIKHKQQQQQNATTTTTTKETTTKFDLRLCDPDWVLGGVYLENVAHAMQNFSHFFAHNPEDAPWTVEIGHIRHRYLKESSSTTMTRPRRRQLQQQEEQPPPLPAPPQQGLEKEPPPPPPPPQESALMEPPTPPSQQQPSIELAVATVRKMNLASVLQQGSSSSSSTTSSSSSYYSIAYDEDEDDMVNDAAQIFARQLHDAWWSSSDSDDSGSNAADYGILVFLSVQDRVCFISTGNAISTILPWWRLDHIVASMKPDLRHREYGHAILRAIADLSRLLQSGPPTLSDRMHDFLARFGVVIAFAGFTFVFGAWGEYRDRRKRWQYAEQRSKLSSVERQKAQQLQKEFKTRCCPICLENFDYGNGYEDDIVKPPPVPSSTADSTSSCSVLVSPHARHRLDRDEDEESKQSPDSLENATNAATTTTTTASTTGAAATDEYGIPRKGADGKRIKMLRCGHIFCETCWKSWVHSGCNPCNCPVCRQDVGKTLSSRKLRHHRSITVVSSNSATIGGMATNEHLPLLSSTAARANSYH